MNQTKYIILGLTPQGLSVLRILGRAGADVTAFCSSKHNVGYHSRYGEKVVFSDIDELKQKIREIVKSAQTKPICYITSGELLAAVLREYKELYKECDVLSGPYSVIEMLAHKDKMYEYAIAKGFRVARYATLDKEDVGALQFPLFLKRNYEIPLFFKAVKINSQEEFKHYFERIPVECRKDVIAQEFINIPVCNLLNITCQGFWVEGKCAGLFVANQKRRLRKGITSYIEEITDKALHDKMSKLVFEFMGELKYYGFAEFEFMYDRKTEVLWFIEVNTRTCGLQSAIVHKFKDLQRLVLNPYDFFELSKTDNPIHWMNIQRDIRARLENNNWKNIGDIFTSKYDILDMHDLLPFFMQFIKI